LFAGVDKKPLFGQPLFGQREFIFVLNGFCVVFLPEKILNALCRHEEVELLVCGLPHLDFNALKHGARYEGGFSAESPIIKTLWYGGKGDLEETGGYGLAGKCWSKSKQVKRL
jgi:hypothetical protein